MPSSSHPPFLGALRCGHGRGLGDAAPRGLPHPPRHHHGDRLPWRHPHENVEDVDSAAHHLQSDHRYVTLLSA